MNKHIRDFVCGGRIWPARGNRAAFSINPGHAPCNYTTNWAGIRGFGPGCPPPPWDRHWHRRGATFSRSIFLSTESPFEHTNYANIKYFDFNPL